MHITEFYELTQAGPDQAHNEDGVAHWAHDGDALVFAVANGLVLDGSGAPDAGQVASTLALEVLGRELDTLPPAWPLRSRLQRAVNAANLELYQKKITVPELRPMRSMLTATAVAGDTLVTAHLGDCRLFLLRDHALVQLTKDHAWAMDGYPAEGPDNGRGRPRRYAVPRCLGHELVVSTDVLALTVRPGDMLLQCTRGLHTALGADDLREALEAHPPEAACRALVRSARLADGLDDMSVQVAMVGGEAAPPARSWWWFGR